MTTEQNFINLQLNDLEIFPRWKELFLELLPRNRMIILYPIQKQQIENISRINNNNVFLFAKAFNNPYTTITVSFLDKLSTKSLSILKNTDLDFM